MFRVYGFSAVTMSRPVYIVHTMWQTDGMGGVVGRISKAWKRSRRSVVEDEVRNAGKGERATILCVESHSSAPYYARISPEGVRAWPKTV